jgi:hypothetical protein
VDEGLLRQRRNLIITCVLLWVMKYGSVTFSKFSLAGFDVEFARPEALYLSIWIAFAYFLYRYYQYFSSEGVQNLQKVFTRALEDKCAPVIRGHVKGKYEGSNDSVGYSYAFLKRDNWIYSGQLIIKNVNGTATATENFQMPVNRWVIRKGIAFALADTVFRNNAVTDYVLPFILAGWVLWYCGSNDWNGSFLRFVFAV